MLQSTHIVYLAKLNKMGDKIFLLNDNNTMVEMNESPYDAEYILQKYLADYPELLSGSQINPEEPRRWLLISREFGIKDDPDSSNRWSLDNLFIDQDGILTLVEVKRSTDTRIRREVVGQILDYAANAVAYLTIEEIKQRFKDSHETSHVSKLNEFINSNNEYEINEAQIENFWEKTKTNLKAGKIRMLIIADKIPKELQRIIEFLNGQMAPAEILGVEIKQFTGVDKTKTFVPRVIGMTSIAQAVKGKQSSFIEDWTEVEFMEFMKKKCTNEEIQALEKLVALLKQHASNIKYINSTTPSLRPYFKGDNYFFQIFKYKVQTTIEIQFERILKKQPFTELQLRINLLNQLNKIKGVSIQEDQISKRPNFKLSLLNDEEELKKFQSVIVWYISKL